MLTYTRQDLSYAVVDATKYPNIDSQLSTQNLFNRVVRIVTSENDLQCLKRKASAIKLFEDEYDYTCPTDLKEIIDIFPQKPRSASQRFTKTTPAEFDRKKSISSNLVTIEDSDLGRKLRFAGAPDDSPATVANLDTLTEDGTWAAFSAGSSGVAADTNNFIQGSGSISFDLVGGTTTAGIENSTFTSADYSKYLTDGSAFLWVYLTTTTNITNVILRIGSSSGNYHEVTVTTQADGSAFSVGWNLVRFDLVNTTDTGTPDDTAVDYCAIYLTKSSGQTGNNFRFDWLRVHTGDYVQVYYYSRYGWANTSTGTTWYENSLGASYYLVATSEEMPLIEACGRREFFKELREFDMMQIADADYKAEQQRYKMKHPSEKLKSQTRYW